MVSIKCGICGKGFEVKEYDAGWRKYCKSRECGNEVRRVAMQRYRQTERGRAMVELQNRRHKRAEREWECFVCKGKFMSAQKRNTCDVCIENLINEGAKSPQLAVTMRKWRAKNMEKVKAHSASQIRADRPSKTRQRLPCLVCNDIKSEQHHHNYKKAKDVTFLCKRHHGELHSWDNV